MTDPWGWHIYIHEWMVFMVNVGTYIIHGSYIWEMPFNAGLGNHSNLPELW